MTDQEKREIKEKIQTDLIELEQSIEKLKEITKPVAPDNAIGRISRMDAINNKAVNDRTLAQDLYRQNALKVVLENLDSPDFGICSFCQNPIAPMRLLYIPETNACVNCASRS